MKGGGGMSADGAPSLMISNTHQLIIPMLIDYPPSKLQGTKAADPDRKYSNSGPSPDHLLCIPGKRKRGLRGRIVPYNW